MGKMVHITRSDDQVVPVYRADPEHPSGAPGIILIQEWWGLNPQIRATADRLAREGFIVLVPDLYRGKIATDAQEAQHMMSDLDWGSALEDIGGIIASGRDGDPGIFGITGFCMGGAVTLLAAAKHPALKAAVPFYGLPQNLEVMANIKVPLQGHWASREKWCSPEAVGKLEAVLNANGIPYEFFWYDADHAFMNEARPEVYDPEAAKVAWARMVTFFRKHLAT